MTPTVAHDKGGWMQTYTGRAFWPLTPKSEHVKIVDIAHSLSMMCRYAGHCIRFYSVAEHCVHVAARAPDHLKLTALLHDASEAYVVDIPRPIKPFLPNYYEIENHLMEMISKKYGTSWPLPDEVKLLDNRILSDEREQNMMFMDVYPSLWGNTQNALGIKLQYWTPEEAELQFLRAFKAYGGRE